MASDIAGMGRMGCLLMSHVFCASFQCRGAEYDQEKRGTDQV